MPSGARPTIDLHGAVRAKQSVSRTEWPFSGWTPSATRTPQNGEHHVLETQGIVVRQMPDSLLPGIVFSRVAVAEKLRIG
jgi:hypothetical protein